MRKLFILLNLVLCIYTVHSQEYQFLFKNIQTYQMNVRANYRTYRNGTYIGLESKEYKSILNVKKMDETVFIVKGTSYQLNQAIYNQKLIGYNIDEVVPTDFWIYKDGVMSVSEDNFPYMRNAPFFPEKFNKDQIFSKNGTFVSEVKFGDFEKKYIMPTTVIIRYNAPSEIFGKKCELFDGTISLQNTPMYKELRRVNGKHNLRIYFDKNIGMPAYIEDNFNESFTLNYNDEDVTITHDGFFLHFYEPYRKLRIHLTAEEINKQFEDEPLLKKNVDVREDTDGLTLVLKDLHFSPDSAKILDEEREIILALSRIISKHKDKIILITGHTADVGYEEGQNALSYARAKAVAEALVDKNINAKQLMIEGKGATEPLAPNDTPENMAKNRRVEVKILGK